MKIFNINDYVYIQITDEGWKHLQETVGQDYIDACIVPNVHLINGTPWYRLQCWDVFQIFPVSMGFRIKFKPNVMIEDKSLIQLP